MSGGVGHTVSKNFAILMVRQVLTWTSTFVLLLFLPRELGPVGYGRYFLAYSIATMFALLIEFGGRFHISKSVSRAPEQTGQIVANATAPRIFLWMLSFAGMLGYAAWAGYHPDVAWMLAIMGLAQLWTGIRSVLWAAFQGREMMSYPSYGVVAQTFFVMAVGVPALLMGIGPVGFAGIMAAGALIDFSINATFMPKMARFTWRVNWAEAVRGLKEGVPYFLNSLFGIIYYRIDSVMLSMMTPEEVVGWYGGAYRFFDALMFIPSLFTIAVYPALARLWGEGSEAMVRSTQKSLDFVIVVGLPIAVGSFVFSEQIIDLFLGLEAYGPSVLLLRIFSAGLLLVYIDVMLGSTLLASDRQRSLSMVGLAAIVVNVGTNALLIPMTQRATGNGGIGSAIATFVTEFFVMVSMTALLDRTLLRSLRVGVQIKAIGAGLLMGAIGWAMTASGIPWWIAAGLSPAVYVAGLFALKAIEPSDLELMRGLLSPLTRILRPAHE